MTDKENFDDSVFSLLMLEVSETQGAELLSKNRELNALEDFENEDERISRGRETIAKELGRQKRKRILRLTAKGLRTLSAAAMLLVVLGTVAYITVPQFRDSLSALTGSSAEPSETSSPISSFDEENDGYVQKEITCEYTDEGIVETIIFENPETGQTRKVTIVTDYPEPTPTANTGERPMITPPPESSAPGVIYP